MNRVGLLLVGVLIITSCGGGGTSNISTSTTPAPQTPAASPSPQTEFEKDLQFIRNGQFTYVYVISRKDEKIFDASDSQFLRTNVPQIVDWARTDGGKKFIAGTNFNLAEGNLEMLKKRYVVEDYSGK